MGISTLKEARARERVVGSDNRAEFFRTALQDEVLGT
jgi:hypothetical protein